MTPGTLLRLGRVSNLPTVWTNALAGAVLAAGTGAPVAAPSVALAALALSALYLGGMWLNDAFDAEIDAEERAGRPIPAGEISRAAVFVGGALLLAAGVALAALASPTAGLVAAALALAVVLYDWLHKRTALAPLIMGATRFLAYGVGAAAVGGIGAAVLIGAAGLFAHVVGLTYAARGEAKDRLGPPWPLAVLTLPLLLALRQAAGASQAMVFVVALAVAMAVAVRFLLLRRPGHVPRGVVLLIAAISLYDAALIAAAGAPQLALLAAGGFILTLVLQRVAPGT